MEFFVKKVFKTSFWLLGCLLIFNFCVDAQEGVIVHKTIPKLSIDSISLREALFELSRNYNVPIGLEMSLGEESKKQILNLQNSTLEDALNSLIATNSNYQWRLNDGVINVYPKINRDIITQELLELNIDRFVIPKSINNLKIRSNLSRLPEISEFLNKRTVTPLNLSFSSFDLINRNLKEKMVFERKSFSQILNSIIKTKISHFWCITRYGENKEFLIVSL